MSSPRSIARRTIGKRVKLPPARYRKLQEYIFERDNGCCMFCGKFGGQAAHVISRAQGGSDEASNIITACISCHALFDAYRLDLPGCVDEMLESEDKTF